MTVHVQMTVREWCITVAILIVEIINVNEIKIKIDKL